MFMSDRILKTQIEQALSVLLLIFKMFPSEFVLLELGILYVSTVRQWNSLIIDLVFNFYISEAPFKD